MHTVNIGGTEYGIRCDINAYEEILERYGDLSSAVKMEEDEKENMRKLKFLAAIFMNEHNAAENNPVRYTETDVGRMMLPGERTAVYRSIVETINEAFAPKN